MGVSGGADSLCLLDLLVKASADVVVAHFNHHLRPEAEEEADKVKSIAHNLHLHFELGQGDASQFAREERLSIEEAARKLRYQFLFNAARKNGAGSIAVAHHADDQVETVLMHFLRGAGLSGLKGMTPVTFLVEFDAHIPLIRPLLKVWRTEIDVYCRENGLEPVQDPSNLDTTYFRNRLRHELIPLMESHHPGFKNNLLRSAQALAGDLMIVESAVDTAWTSAIRAVGNDHLSFKLGVLEKMDIPLLRNLIRRGAGKLNPGLRNIDFADVDRLVHFIVDHNRPGQVDLAGGLYALKEKGELILASSKTTLPTLDWPQVTQPFELVVGATQPLNDAWTISSQLLEKNALIMSFETSSDQFQAWLDADAFREILYVRARRNGDRVQPLGMTAGSLKLSDVFINQKIPWRARKLWPLLCAGERIAWIPGYRPCHLFRVTEVTSSVLHLEVKKVDRD